MNVQGQRSGTIAPFAAPGSRPTFLNNDPINADSTTIEVLGSSTHIAGVDLVGAGQFSGFFLNAASPAPVSPTATSRTWW